MALDLDRSVALARLGIGASSPFPELRVALAARATVGNDTWHRRTSNSPTFAILNAASTIESAQNQSHRAAARTTPLPANLDGQELDQVRARPLNGLPIPVPPRTATHPGPDAPGTGTKDRRHGGVVVAIGPLVATNGVPVVRKRTAARSPVPKMSSMSSRKSGIAAMIISTKSNPPLVPCCRGRAAQGHVAQSTDAEGP